MANGSTTLYFFITSYIRRTCYLLLPITPKRELYLNQPFNPIGLVIHRKSEACACGIPKSTPKWVSPIQVINEKDIGIDLGTTNFAIATMEGGKPTIIIDIEGQRTTPFVVAYTKNGDRLVNQIAKRQAVVNLENTLFSIKRYTGRKMSKVDEESKQVSYKVIKDDNGNIKLDCPVIGKQFVAEKIFVQVLRKLVDDASKFLNYKVTKAVVTVPAYFNDLQTTAIKAIAHHATTRPPRWRLQKCSIVVPLPLKP
ncbi:Stromal 70 kDa heat shock-related protein [Spatholobus suberectus]|nr:Stromal 70 kDa heat shock-related protein [Spatholobus suberectus]